MYEPLHHKIDQDLVSNPFAVEERITFLKLLKFVSTQHPDAVFKQGLDIGTVTGFYPTFFSFAAMGSYAVNISAAALRYARELSNYGLQGTNAAQADIQNLPFSANSFDLISIMTGTFSHLQRGNHLQALDEVARILCPGGIVIISDWNIKAEAQDFFGWFTPEQQQELRENHYGYPHLCQSLKQRNLEISSAALLAQQRWYMVAARKNKSEFLL